jgi:hypothetical protein
VQHDEYSSSSDSEELTENSEGELVQKGLFWPHKFQHSYGDVDIKGLRATK